MELRYDPEKRGLNTFILVTLNGLGSMKRYRNSPSGQWCLLI